MCKYNYGKGRCANNDVDAPFCVGETNCRISDILQTRHIKTVSEKNSWQELPSKVWTIGKKNMM
jgi:hypothetical protein